MQTIRTFKKLLETIILLDMISPDCLISLIITTTEKFLKKNGTISTLLLLPNLKFLTLSLEMESLMIPRSRKPLKISPNSLLILKPAKDQTIQLKLWRPYPPEPNFLDKKENWLLIFQNTSGLEKLRLLGNPVLLNRVLLRKPVFRHVLLKLCQPPM